MPLERSRTISTTQSHTTSPLSSPSSASSRLSPTAGARPDSRGERLTLAAPSSPSQAAVDLNTAPRSPQQPRQQPSTGSKSTPPRPFSTMGTTYMDASATVSDISKVPFVPTSAELLHLYGPKPVRAQFACDYCRQRKAKCSGDDPCQRCTTKRRACTYSTVQGNRKVTRSLRDLQAARADRRSSPGGSAPPNSALRIYLDRQRRDGVSRMSPSSAHGGSSSDEFRGSPSGNGSRRHYVPSSAPLYPAEWATSSHGMHNVPPNYRRPVHGVLSTAAGFPVYQSAHDGALYEDRSAILHQPHPLAYDQHLALSHTPMIGVGMHYGPQEFTGLPPGAEVVANGGFAGAVEQSQHPMQQQQQAMATLQVPGAGHPMGWRSAPLPPPLPSVPAAHGWWPNAAQNDNAFAQQANFHHHQIGFEPPAAGHGDNSIDPNATHSPASAFYNLGSQQGSGILPSPGHHIGQVEDVQQRQAQGMDNGQISQAVTPQDLGFRAPTP